MLGRFSFIFYLFLVITLDDGGDLEFIGMIGYFKFVDDGVTKNGLFHKFDGNQFFSVQLFQAVEKMTDRNDPLYVVEKPQLRFVPELILDTCRTFAVGLSHPKVPIYVVHRQFFEDESIVFRHGMDGIFSIANKIVDEEGNFIPCDGVDFPISSLESLLTENVLDPAVLLRPPTFLDIQFDMYQFRNRLAQHSQDDECNTIDNINVGSLSRPFLIDYLLIGQWSTIDNKE